jgi:small nuclear ribonucleoprotein (snRNP)-like protein
VTDVLIKRRNVRKALSTNSGRNTDATSLRLRDTLEQVDAYVNIYDEDSEKRDYSLPEQFFVRIVVHSKITKLRRLSASMLLRPRKEMLRQKAPRTPG